VRRPEYHPPSRSNRVRRRVRDKPATQPRRSPESRETGASSGGRNPAEQHPIPLHPLGAPWPPRSIQGKMLIAISESRGAAPKIQSVIRRMRVESIGFCAGFTDGFERRQPIQSLETLGEVVGVEEVACESIG